MKNLFLLLLVFTIGYSVHASKTSPKSKVETVYTKKPTPSPKTSPKKSSKVTTHVTLTCYQPVASQCNSDCLHTADNSKIDLNKLAAGKIKWVAISRDLLYMIPMGSKVKITNEDTGKCYGVYTVKDKMNKRWKHRMDILIHPNSKERIYAENIKVELLG